MLFAKGSNMLEDAELEQAACRNRKYERDPRGEKEMIREAVKVAERADVVLAAVGEPAWMTGEASSRTSRHTSAAEASSRSPGQDRQTCGPAAVLRTSDDSGMGK